MGALNDLAVRIAEVNKANGWFDEYRPFSADIALMHTEVSEAYEEERNGHQPWQRYYSYADGTAETPDLGGVLGKPEGVPSELADVLIRVLDTAFRYGIDMDAVLAEKLAYNATRGYRHGGKRA
jgi:NTP pyrophosphatase (non-canonical NTP hydrolase)